MSTLAQATPFSIRLDKEKRTRLNRLAKAHERTSHALAIKALDEYLEREEARLAYEQQAIRAYETLQLTGAHVEHDELKQWANSLNTSNPMEAPKCHG